MRTDSLTRTYAKALYTEVAEAGEQADVYDQLAAVAGAIAAEPGLLQLLKHPALPVADKVALLLKAASSDNVTATLARFLELVLRKGRPNVLRSADRAFMEFWDADRSLLRARATSALPLSEQEKDSLTDALASLSSSRVELETSIDRALIGGVAVRFRDRLIDGSIGGKLSRLSERLQEY